VINTEILKQFLEHCRLTKKMLQQWGADTLSEQENADTGRRNMLG
jgi:hypothetical protein